MEMTPVSVRFFFYYYQDNLTAAEGSG